MIEGEHEELIVGVQELEEELLDRGPRVDHAPAEHAVAHVEEHAEADRNALVRELRDRLRLAILEHLEGLARKAMREAALRVEDRGGDGHHVDARPQHTVAALNLLGSGRGGRDGQGGQTEDRDEPRGTHTHIVNLPSPSAGR